MALVKNVRPYSVDVGGRALAPGEGPVDLSLDAPAVAELLELGHLVVCLLPDPPASENQPARTRTTSPANPASPAGTAPAEES